jgi:PEGA domain
MKGRLLIVFVLLVCGRPLAAVSWQYGRIADVRKSVTTKTKAWVVNTPINEDETTCTIWVHLQDSVVVGTHELSPGESAPPEEWVTKYPVKVQLQGDTMYLRSPAGDLRLHIIQRRRAREMLPLTTAEKKRLEQLEAPPQSLTGFAEDSKSAGAASKPAPEAAPPQPPQPLNVGTVNVRSTPYLSEVFVDGDSMGYTPAKINLAPGKHTFLVKKPGYKPWVKEMMITVGSELTLDASLEKK